MDIHSHHGHKGVLNVGKDFIGKGASCDLTGDVTIGNEVTICEGTKIITHIHSWNTQRPRRETKEIEVYNLKIEDDVFIGIDSKIIGIKNIGKGAIIGAGSVVTKDIPRWGIWAGNPAKMIGFRQ